MSRSGTAKANGSQTNASCPARWTTAINPPNSACSASLEQAKGVLMESFGVSKEQADEVLHTWGRQRKRTPEAVAEVSVHQVWQGEETCPDRNVAPALERNDDVV
jgi:hypothetical protein